MQHLVTHTIHPPPPTVHAGATFDHGGRYRYTLWRVWDPAGPRLVFVMLNPSTADAVRNDPTVRRCIGFAVTWGFSSIEVVNLCAYRAVRPSVLLRATDPVGPENELFVHGALQRAGLIVVAWGNHGASFVRGCAALRRWSVEKPLYSFGTTRLGQPRHPLYVRTDAPIERFSLSEKPNLL